MFAKTLPSGEQAVLFTKVRAPEDMPLGQVDNHLRKSRSRPVEDSGGFRLIRRISMLPRFLRRLIWWVTLDWSGRLREKYFGTFGVTSVGNWGVESIRPIAPAIVWQDIRTAERCRALTGQEQLFGGLLDTSQFPTAFWSLIASVRGGILAFNPVLLVAMAGVPWLYRRHRALTMGIGVAFGAHLLFYATTRKALPPCAKTRPAREDIERGPQGKQRSWSRRSTSGGSAGAFPMRRVAAVMMARGGRAP